MADSVYRASPPFALVIFASLYVLLRLHVDLVRIQSRSTVEVELGAGAASP